MFLTSRSHLSLTALCLLFPTIAALGATQVSHGPAPAKSGTTRLESLEIVEAQAGPRSPEDEATRVIHNIFPDPTEIAEPLPAYAPPKTDGPLIRGRRPLTDAALPSIDLRFDGPYQGGVTPPDPVMTVGNQHVVALINNRIAFYDKSGNLVDGPFSLKSFFGIPSGFTDFDPLAIYDPFSQRYILATLADSGAQQDSRIYLAFSQTADATGNWNTYYIDADRDQGTNWADYNSIGIDRNAVYLTANMFNRSDNFQNVTIFIYDKEDGYAGAPLDNTHLIDVRTSGGAAPYRLRPATVNSIVPGDEYYLMHTSNGFTSSMNLFRLTGDRFTDPTLETESLSLPRFVFGPGNATQPGTETGVSTLGSSLWNVFYRAGKLWTGMAIDGSNRIAIWVHRVDVSANPATLEQTYEFEEANEDSYFPHVLPDSEDHDFAIMTAFSGPNRHVTGRYWNIAADGTIRKTELLIDSGRANTSGRHGDYFAVAEDPTDTNRVWMIAQYMQNSSFSGNQIIASVPFEDSVPSAGPPPTPDGRNVPGSQVQVRKASGSDLTITWGTENCDPGNNHLVWFDLADISNYSIVDETCAIGLSGTWTGTPPTGLLGVVVVSDDGAQVEGSMGTDSSGIERPAISTVCTNEKDTTGSCP